MASAHRKPLDLRPIRPSSTRIPPLAALLFIVCVLLVFNLSNWRFLRELQASKQGDLEKRLRAVAATAVHGIEGHPGVSLITEIAPLAAPEKSFRLQNFALTAEYDSLLTTLLRMQASAGLSQLVLLTPDGVVIADGSFRTAPGDPYLFTIDAEYIERTRQHGTTLTPLYTIGNEVYQRIYHPMRRAEQVVALLQASVSPDYLLEVQTTRARVFRLWALSSLLLVGIGLSLYRVFRYLVRLERSTMQGARVEAMGALAGGLAHELRNPLAIIRALAEEISAEQPEKSRSAQNAKDIVQETQRLGTLVSHFLSLSQPPTMENSLVNLNNELSQVVQLLRRGTPEEVRIEADLPVDDLLVRADERALRQLLLNLLLNAKEALRAEGGQVTAILRERRGHADLRVIDNGIGIPPRQISRVYDPFFTTKSTGTGLGLAISRSIAENLGGSLDVRSTEGRGTEVTLLLPLVNN